MTNFPQRLKSLREKKGLLQKELAAHLGVSRATLASWESGNRTPELGAAKNLADFFNVSMDYLLGSTFHDDTSVADLSILLSCSEIVFDGEIYKLDDELRQGIHDAIEFVLYKSKKRNKK